MSRDTVGTYPLHASRPYPKEQWYVAAYRSEVVAGQILSRRIFDEAVILFRPSDGRVSALSNLCAHRFMPLDYGSVVDGHIVCPYHGYTYGADGRCVRIATGGTPSPHARLRAYPVVEDGPFVWIWTGTPERSADVPLPDLSDIGLSGDGAGWRVDIATRLDLKARTALLVDNLFDLSHIAFIHRETLTGAGSIAVLPPVFDATSQRFRVGRDIPGYVVEPGSRYAAAMPMAVGRPVYASLHTEFYGPAVINSSGPWFDELVDGEKPGAPIGRLNFVHLMTPETAHSTHYFNVVSRNYDLDDEALSARLVLQTDRVRMEDVEWLERIEQIADGLSAKREISSKADEGALKVRRHLRIIIENEQAAGAA